MTSLHILHWAAMHPVIVHFPIVLLLVSPFFVLIAVVLRPPKNRPYLTVGLITLLLGTFSLFLAALSGEEAAQLNSENDSIRAMLKTHETLALQAEIVFALLSLSLAGLFFWPWISIHPSTRVSTTIAPLLFLTAYAAGVAYLLMTAHLGGTFVHESGAHRTVTSAIGDPATYVKTMMVERSGDGNRNQEYSGLGYLGKAV